LKKAIGITIVLILAALLAYPKVMPLFSTPDKEGNPQNSSSLLQVEAIQVQEETIEDQIFTSGTVLAHENRYFIR
jgi:hypothetical protein